MYLTTLETSSQTFLQGCVVLTQTVGEDEKTQRKWWETLELQMESNQAVSGIHRALRIVVSPQGDISKVLIASAASQSESDLRRYLASFIRLNKVAEGSARCPHSREEYDRSITGFPRFQYRVEANGFTAGDTWFACEYRIWTQLNKFIMEAHTLGHRLGYQVNLRPWAPTADLIREAHKNVLRVRDLPGVPECTVSLQQRLADRLRTAHFLCEEFLSVDTENAVKWFEAVLQHDFQSRFERLGFETPDFLFTDGLYDEALSVSIHTSQFLGEPSLDEICANAVDEREFVEMFTWQPAVQLVESNTECETKRSSLGGSSKNIYEDDLLNDGKTIDQPVEIKAKEGELSSGSHLGQYRIIRLLGRGGMGEVYEVEHQVLRRRFALKLIPQELVNQKGFLERFKREAEVMANLDHPHIVKVDEFGETGGNYWLRMELVQGLESEGKCVGTLADLAESCGGKVEQGLLADIFSQILDGLSYAHNKGAIHRDLKPANILLKGEDPSSIEGKISDFGLVRLVGEEWVRSKAEQSVSVGMSLGDQATEVDKSGTSSRSLLGTYEYMSPEQKRGEEADAKSDIYAVGLMIHRLLTGERELSYELPSAIDNKLVQEWDDIVKLALKPKKDQRFSSTGEMAEAVKKLWRHLIPD